MNNFTKMNQENITTRRSNNLIKELLKVGLASMETCNYVLDIKTIKKNNEYINLCCCTVFFF